MSDSQNTQNRPWKQVYDLNRARFGGNPSTQNGASPGDNPSTQNGASPDGNPSTQNRGRFPEDMVDNISRASTASTPSDFVFPESLDVDLSYLDAQPDEDDAGSIESENWYQRRFQPEPTPDRIVRQPSYHPTSDEEEAQQASAHELLHGSLERRFREYAMLGRKTRHPDFVYMVLCVGAGYTGKTEFISHFFQRKYRPQWYCSTKRVEYDTCQDYRIGKDEYTIDFTEVGSGIHPPRKYNEEIENQMKEADVILFFYSTSYWSTYQELLPMIEKALRLRQEHTAFTLVGSDTGFNLEATERHEVTKEMAEEGVRQFAVEMPHWSISAQFKVNLKPMLDDAVTRSRENKLFCAKERRERRTEWYAECSK